jgi:ring-1,2-phenylacetyl-CoA epoxidase subunit PaaE
MIIIFLNLPKKAMASFHTLRVSHIDRITTKAVVVSFEIPTALKNDFNFLGGQYISVQTHINGEQVRRSYSICSAPHSETLQIGIKEVPEGVFSTYVNQHLKVGDEMEVSPPEGRFTLNSPVKENLIIGIAAGSGITPIMSIIKSILDEESNTQFVLLYGNKSPKETMFYEDLLTLEKANSERLKIHWSFSQANVSNANFGRIDIAQVNYLLNQIDMSASKAFYLCGPESMIQTASDQLIEKGVKKETVFFELFTASSENLAVESSVEKGTLSLTCDDVTHSLKLVPGKTLLDIALQAKIDVPYSCQGGVCSSCIAKVTEGKATMQSNQILTDEEVKEGLVLSCQAIAQSETISLDFDDV